ncbi:hypothetical protein OIU34_18585 [Pararhizobium sp. BT-229]|uniref:hypothetical protein n=1 Tax=Pararhizobium sp. BT-229 TaxID=2986923 RepID=UPI0021F7B9EB|nr:hypothetical protein [Pararhizobium sp. BT-229]MCV9963887.1 hypothetical protein [Pararhizobium sp. BT-229]
MSTTQNDETIREPTPEQQKSLRDRLREAFSNPTEEHRRQAASIEEVGKRAFMEAVNRVIATMEAIGERLEYENSNPIWASLMSDFLEQAYHTSNAVTFLPPETIIQGPRQKPPRYMSTTQNKAAPPDLELELQKAYRDHLRESFANNTALHSIEEARERAFTEAVNRVIATIGMIEERLEYENSNPIWASPMRDFLEQAEHTSREIKVSPKPIIQGPRRLR